MKAVIDSMLRYYPEPGVANDLALTDAKIKYLEKKFEEKLSPGALGGMTVESGQSVYVCSRGWMKDKKLYEDKRFLGPLLEIYVNEDKLDGRSKAYQVPVVEQAIPNEQGVISSPTGSGKTVMEAILIGRIQRRTLVLAPTKEIVGQIRRSIKEVLGIDPGMIGDQVRVIKPVTVGLYQAIKPNDPVLQNIGLLVIDEAHSISAPSYLRILRECPAYYRFGLTATEEKTGGTEAIIYAAIGPLLNKIEVKDLQAQGYLNKGVYKPIYTTAVATRAQYVSSRCWYFRKAQEEDVEAKCPSPCTYPANGEVEKCVYEKGYYGWIYSQLSKDELRNQKIIEMTVAASKEHPWLIVLTHLKKHVHQLAEMFQGSGIKSVWKATGPPMKKKDRQAAIDGYKQHGGVLIGTSSIIGIGFDAPKTSCLVRAMPSGGKVSVRQHTGRIMRPQEKESLIIDLVDSRIPWLKRLWFGRRSIYHSIGFTEKKKSIEPGLFS